MILLMSAVIAVALGVTCAMFVGTSGKVDVDNAENGQVSASSSFSNLTGSTLQTYISNGTAKAGDTVNYSYNGSSYSVTLPVGTYSLEVWGGQGGKGISSVGGYGGYAKGTYKVTTPTTIYIYIGGAGSYSSVNGRTTAGGYNGGGSTTYRRGCGHYAGSGGGATHIATRSGLLSSLGSYKSSVLIVGGGGGGGGALSGTIKGGNGGPTGGDGGFNSSYTNKAAGATASSYGTYTAGNRPYSMTAGKSGAFGQGGNGPSVSSAGGGGGGGGGYYGGASGGTRSCNGCSGGGGSNFINAQYVTSVSNTSQTSVSGSGKATLTILNRNPLSNDTTISGTYPRSNNCSISISASTVASDPEKTTVYFSAGNSSNYDTSAAANAGVWLNSACTISATPYINWTFSASSSATTLRITKIFKYPRAGYDQCTTNGKLVLYTRVRDSYGSATTRGVSVIKFTLNVGETAPTAKSISSQNGTELSTGLAETKAYLGQSKINQNPDQASVNNIYNPTSAGRYTLMINKPLRILSGSASQNDVAVRLNANDIFSGLSGYDKALFVLNDVSKINKNDPTRLFKVVEYDAGSSVTAYNSSGAALSNAFTQITLVGVNTSSQYQVFPVTMYVVETNSAKGNNTNFQLYTVSAIPLDIVFKVDNSRPTLKDGVSALVSVNTLQTATIRLNDFYKDDDNATITSATHRITGVKVPSKEFIQLDKYGKIVPTVANGKSYYNVVNTSAKPDAAALTTALTTGEAGISTGFYVGSISAQSSDPTAFIQYTFNNDALTITGLRATYSQYGRIGSLSSASGGDNKVGVSATSGTVENAGDFYILINVQDLNDVDDKGIWLPVAVRVNNVDPTPISTERGQQASSVMPTASGAKTESFYFTPMGITVDRETKPIGYRKVGSQYVNVDLRPLASDADNYYKPNMLDNDDSAQGKLNELIEVVSTPEEVRNSVAFNSGGEYFDVAYENIYIPKSYFGKRIVLDGLTTEGDYVVVKGYKITLNNWTHNRYLYANVGVRDSAKKNVVNVNIAVNVTNETPVLLTGGDGQKVATLDYSYNGKTVTSSYTYVPQTESSPATATLKYRVPVKSTFFITPYDILNDYNMITSGVVYPENGFTLNGLKGYYSNNVFNVGAANGAIEINPIATSANTTNNKYNYGSPEYTASLKTTLDALTNTKRNIPSASDNNNFAAPTGLSAGIDRLFFERADDADNLDGARFDPYTSNSRNNFAMPVVVNGNYVNSYFGSSIVFNGSEVYNIDFLIIDAQTRTPAGMSVDFTLTVRDRMGAGASGDSSGITRIKVSVEVINSTPYVKADADKIYTLATTPIIEREVEGEEEIVKVITPTTITLSKDSILQDAEDDTPSFFVGEDSIKVIDSRGDIGSTNDGHGNTYRGNYIDVTLTSDTMVITALNSTQSIQNLYVRFYAADGRADETTIKKSPLYLQIQVINSAMTVNTGADGFEQSLDSINGYLWSVSSLNASDKTAARYFASSTTAVEQLKTNAPIIAENGDVSGATAASESQIKRLVNDTDKLQGIALTPAGSPSSASPSYIKLNGTNYADFVPYAGRAGGVNGTASIAVTADMVNAMGNYTNNDATFIDYCEIVYFIKSNNTYTAYTATQLRKGGIITDDNRALFFDAAGRWIVNDWAVIVKPKDAFPTGNYLSLNFMMRDETRYGGDTADNRNLPLGVDEKSGWLDGKPSAVKGFTYQQYFMFVKNTGIVTYDYYDRFGGYYAVADGFAEGKNYIPTKVGDKVDADIYSENYAPAAGTTAFKYSHTIEVSANKSEYTYIPMSYFSMKAELVNIDDTGSGSYTYPQDSYVAYDIDSNADGYVLKEIGDIKSAITISDGVNRWGGDSVNDLQSNPYVVFTAYDATGETDSNNEYLASTRGKYFNQYLAVSTVYADKDTKERKEYNFVNNADYASSLVAGKDVAHLINSDKGLAENLFGIGIRKNETRSSAANLTLSVKVALCTTANNGTRIDYNANDPGDVSLKTATVTFNIKIGNDMIDLATQDSDVKADASGYYTNVYLKSGDNPYSIGLARQKNVEDGNDATVVFNDGDSTDNAYFYTDSLKMLSSWSGGENVYGRVKDLSNSGGLVAQFVNTMSSDNAQKSLRNYFGDVNIFASSVEALDGTYTPNDGKYGSNDEGYSDYFTVAMTDGGSRMVISPLAKTTVNSDILSGKNQTEIENFYKERGLKYVDGSAYYPLKVLIYDSCGDGWSEASYTAVELRVYISDTLPTLSSGLDNNPQTKDKKISVTLAVGSTYRLNLTDVIADNDLMRSDDGWAWVADYEKLKDDTSDPNSQLRAETGDYLLSPFIGWQPAGSLANANSALRSGNATFTDVKGKADSELPDVVMSMAYDGEYLTAASSPASNVIEFRVIRRTTYYENNTTKTQNKFDFKLSFATSGNKDQKTGTLTVEIEVENQKPTTRTNDIKSTVRMRVGDTFTVLTTPYDRFNDGSASADASTTVKGYYSAGKRMDQNTGLVYSNMTESALRTKYALRDAQSNDSPNVSLGYVAVADDDTPWSLRIADNGVSIPPSYNSCLSVELFDKMRDEGDKGTWKALNAVVKAQNVCNNVPITFTIVDGEVDSRVTCTFYITVVSSKPAPITREQVENKEKTLNAGLSFATNPNDGNKDIPGVYNAYMTAYNGVSNSSSVKLNDGNTVTAYGKLTVDINKVAYDVDTADQQVIGLYYPENNNASIFTVNGEQMQVSEDGYTYSNDVYSITVNNTRTQFTITCLSYDSLNEYSELQFYVKDAGNNILENAIPITLRISTLYSGITNSHAANKTQLIGGNIVVQSADKVHVKSYDKYVGNSIAEDDPEYDSTVGVQSTYQFLQYADMPSSVDQTASDSGAYIHDYDVFANTYNLIYDVKVYAFIDIEDGQIRSKSLSDVSDFLNIDKARGYFRLKSVDDVENYLVGGRQSTGVSYDGIANNELLSYIRQYFYFSIGLDGVSLTLRPVTSNVNVPILFYVEVQKDVGNRQTRPSDDTPISAGSLFYVEVDDSAPIANINTENMTFTGKVNDSHTFTIFDNEKPETALFTDSDVGDVVKVKNFAGAGSLNADYESALSGVDLDWKAGANKVRAIDISVKDNELKVTIRRRIDVKDKDGNYLEKVTLPVKIKGWDSADVASEVIIYVVIENSDLTIADNALCEDRMQSVGVPSLNGVGYTLAKGEEPYKFTLNTYVSKDTGVLSLSAIRWLSDPDFTSVVADTESYRLVHGENVNDKRFLVDKPVSVYATVDGVVTDTEIAVLEPIFTNNDHYHFTGFTVTATSFLRGYTGTAYIRILDRSGNAERFDAGVTLTVNVTILNSAPKIVPGKENIEFMFVGSNTKEIPTETISIKDFVTDDNETDRPDQAGKTNTYLRITNFYTLEPQELYTTVEENFNNDIFLVGSSESDEFNITCKISPLTGYYGTQTLYITVADGDPAVDSETRTVTFSVDITIAYDFDEISEFKVLNAVRGMTTKVDIESIIDEIPNTWREEDDGSADAVMGARASGAARADDDTSTFNPGAGYVITKLSVPNSYVDYATASQDENGDWQFRALRVTANDTIRLDAEFKLASKVDDATVQPYKKSFSVTIAENPKPILIDAFKGGYVFYSTGDYSFMLNQDGSVYLQPHNMFTDNVGDVMKFVSVSTQAPALATAKIIADDNLQITFMSNGTTNLTVAVADSTGESISYTFAISNYDLPDPAFWSRIVISFQTSTYIWLIILGAVLLAIIILIIIIIAVKRRKRKRDELEAMLISELELEEQMMRLSAAPGAMPYQSYGYLPPTMNVQDDPGLMLGGGTGAPANDVLNLNPGQPTGNGAAGRNNGVPNDSDM